MRARQRAGQRPDNKGEVFQSRVARKKLRVSSRGGEGQARLRGSARKHPKRDSRSVGEGAARQRRDRRKDRTGDGRTDERTGRQTDMREGMKIIIPRVALGHRCQQGRKARLEEAR